MADIDSTQVLIVDDDDQDFNILRELLNRRQLFPVNLHRSQTLLDAVAFLQSYPVVDLVLLNQSLSGAYELEPFQQIHAAFPRLPIILLSETPNESTALAALHQGAQDYLIKGRFDGTRLHRSIQYALERQQQLLELELRNLALETLSQQLEKANRELECLTRIDELTQVCNRRQLDKTLKVEWSRLLRSEKALSLLMCDVDYFKAYNDAYGHPMGDRCLQQVAHSISAALQRPADLVARYGGEEFMVLLPNTGLAGAMHVAAQIQAKLYEQHIPHAKSSVSDRVTLSIGIASEIPKIGASITALVEQADQYLYAAKEQGRNQIYSALVLPSRENKTSAVSLPSSVCFL